MEHYLAIKKANYDTLNNMDELKNSMLRERSKSQKTVLYVFKRYF